MIKSVFIVCGVVGILAVGGWYYSSVPKGTVSEITSQPSSGCLADGDYVEYAIENNRVAGAESYLRMKVFNSEGNMKDEFVESITQPGHYHPYESRPCATYFLQSENYNYEKREGEPNYLTKVKSINYSGEEVFSLVLGYSESGEVSDYVISYNNDFRVSPNEEYILLIQGYVGSNNRPYALVVKDMETLENIFVVTFDELWQQNDLAAGDFRPLEWESDEELWIRLSEAAYTNGWLRINTTDWSHELFAAPEGILGGYPLNTSTGWVPLIPGAFWTGVVEFNEEIAQEREGAGERVQLYLYNIITEELRLVETSDKSTWQNLRAEWIDDNVLEYNHPSGERKRYTLNQ